MKTVLYMHMGSGNHGCEALVRTTTKIVKDNLDSDVILWTGSREEELKYGIDKVVDKIVVSDELNKKSFGFLKAYARFKIKKDNKALHNEFIRSLFSDSIAISIGGDNYCYPWSAKQGVELDKEIRRYCKKNVFWGCSIEEEFMTPEVIEDLKGFDLITVRESLSYEVLKAHGINAVQVADPAFLLETKEVSLPDGFIEGNTVGINISPLINDYESGENIALQNYINLIEYILGETDMSVCLIPHVVWEYNNDFEPIYYLYDRFKENNRVVKMHDCLCEEIKYVISKCRFFVGARTHATISAYSTCVPTLVVGYSIKSRGIAKDLFGSYEDYVLSVQGLEDESDLRNKFIIIQNNERSIATCLRETMPGYIELSSSAGKALLSLMKG